MRENFKITFLFKSQFICLNTNNQKQDHDFYLVSVSFFFIQFHYPPMTGAEMIH